MTENSDQRPAAEPRPGAIDVVGVGYSCTDFIATVAAMPEIDTKTAVSSLHVQGGGPAATALVTLSRLGARAALLAKTGDDLPGRMAVSELGREAVDTSGVIAERGAQSPCSFILVDEPTGKRTVFWTRGSVEALDPAEIDRAILLSARWLLIDDLEWRAQEEAARLAGAAGIPVVMDAGSVREGVDRLIPHVTHLVASEGFPRALTGVDDPGRAAAALLEMGPEVVAVTLGARGCLAIDRAGGQFTQPGFAVKVVDTLGAGDVFHGAYVRGLLEDWDLPRVLEFACAVAALKCTKHGGREGIPSMGEAAAFQGW